MGQKTENTKDKSRQEERIRHECYSAPEIECTPSHEAKQNIKLNTKINFYSIPSVNDLLCVDLYCMTQGRLSQNCREFIPTYLQK